MGIYTYLYYRTENGKVEREGKTPVTTTFCFLGEVYRHRILIPPIPAAVWKQNYYNDFATAVYRIPGKTGSAKRHLAAVDELVSTWDPGAAVLCAEDCTLARAMSMSITRRRGPPPDRSHFPFRRGEFHRGTREEYNVIKIIRRRKIVLLLLYYNMLISRLSF